MTLLAAQPENDFPLTDETVSPGLVGFAVFVLLCLAVFLLVRSMNKQMGRIQVPREAELEEQEERERDRPVSGTRAAGRDEEGSQD